LAFVPRRIPLVKLATRKATPQAHRLQSRPVGLVPAFECYGGCSGAWGFYINESLRNLITGGAGQPNPQES
jgi:hypothetical protein